MNNKPIFIDGIKQINFMSSTIRMELFYNKPTEYDDENKESAGELIMTVDGFLSAMNAMEETAHMLVEKGILQKRDNVQRAHDTE